MALGSSVFHKAKLFSYQNSLSLPPWAQTSLMYTRNTAIMEDFMTWKTSLELEAEKTRYIPESY